MPQAIRTDLDLMHAAAAGVSVKAVRHLQRHVGLTNREMSEVLSISESTLARREQQQKPLSRDEAEKTINVALGGIRPQSLLASALSRE